MKFSKFLSLPFAAAAVSAGRVVYVRQEDGEVVVSTIPETVTTSTITYETTLEGENAPTTEVSVDSTVTDFTITRPEESITIQETTTTSITFSPDTTEANGSTFTFTSTETETTIPVSTTVFQVTSFETHISIDSYETQVDVDGSTVTVTVPGTETDVTVASEEVTVTIEDTTTSEAIFSGVTATSDSDSTSFDITVTLTIPMTTTVYTPSETAVAVTIPGTTTTVTLSEVSTVTTETVITIPEHVTTYTVGASDESATTEESTTSEESTTMSEESTASEESTTSEESSSSMSEESTTMSEESSSDIFEESSSSISGTVSTPTASAPTANPTYCEVVRGPLTPEEEVQLKVLFSDRAGASAFADYVVSYASQLVAQIDSVANIAVGDNNYAFTTAFDTIDIPGVLGLASAAPIYTCFLSSLWAEALSNPQQYAKRAVPTQDEKIKLIVLFEKREDSGMQFDYAELLVDETNDLIAEIQSVSAAAANGDLAAYASLFANVDVPYFLSIATEAPIYTEGLSAALQTALSSYSESLRPTVTAMTTRTYTTVNTITTDVVSGTVTVPTTYYSTEIVVTVVPAGQVQTASRIPQPAPAPTTAVPEGYRVTTECVTLANGRVETRTVTVCVENCETVVAQSTRRPSVATYTQVQNGVTYTHTIEIQTKNAALKKVAALGAGILGGAALLL